jgi:hypothetical protein
MPSPTGLSPALATRSSSLRLTCHSQASGLLPAPKHPSNPRTTAPAGSHTPPWFGLCPVRSPLLRASSLFLGVLRCFSSPGSLPVIPDDGVSPPPGCPIRRSRDRRLPAPPPGISSRGHVLPRQPAPRHPPCAHHSGCLRAARASFPPGGQDTPPDEPLCFCAWVGPHASFILQGAVGGAAGARTPNLRRARAALSQLSYDPGPVGAPGLEPGTSALSGPRSDQLSYAPAVLARSADDGEAALRCSSVLCAPGPARSPGPPAFPSAARRSRCQERSRPELGPAARLHRARLDLGCLPIHRWGTCSLERR